MAMAASATNSKECGYCLRTCDTLENPKVLPCTHVHCVECLTAYYDINHIVQCPLPACRYVLEEPKMLPYTYEHYLECAIAYDGTNHMVQCSLPA